LASPEVGSVNSQITSHRVSGVAEIKIEIVNECTVLTNAQLAKAVTAVQMQVPETSLPCGELMQTSL
jgi:hypothetical protein